MSHELAGAFEQSGGVWQRCAMEESDVYVRHEYIDVAEWCVSQAGGWTTIVQKLADFISALSHDIKPMPCNVSKRAGMLLHLGIDGARALDRAIEAQKILFHPTQSDPTTIVGGA